MSVRVKLNIFQSKIVIIIMYNIIILFYYFVLKISSIYICFTPFIGEANEAEKKFEAFLETSKNARPGADRPFRPRPLATSPTCLNHPVRNK